MVVLFLAYFFPPLGGGGTQRSVGFARHLPTFGYEPVVDLGEGLRRTAESLGA